MKDETVPILPSGSQNLPFSIFHVIGFNACPYCGAGKEEGDLCCGEVHDTTLYEDGQGNVYEEDELPANTVIL